MNLYVGSVEKWNQFFKCLGFKENESGVDLSHLVKSLSDGWFRPITEAADYFQSSFIGAIDSEQIKRIGTFTKKTGVAAFCSFGSKDRESYEKLLVSLANHYAEFNNPTNLLEHFFIEPYQNFYQYNGWTGKHLKKNSIFHNLTDVWSPSYLPMLSTTFVISNAEDATHKICFIPYDNLTEIWLLGVSVDFYRFRCFAEMIVVNALAGYLDYEYLEEVTIDDLKKYNADLILNLDLLQQSDLPVE